LRAGGAGGAARSRSALPRFAHVIGRLSDRVILACPALLQLRSRIGMAVGLSRVALPAPARTYLLSFPMSLRQRWIAASVPLGKFIEPVLLGSDRESIHYGLDAGNTARNRNRVRSLLLVVDPASQLHDSFTDRPDVDRALTQDGIVVISL
jgi:hypothetical protein